MPDDATTESDDERAYVNVSLVNLLGNFLKFLVEGSVGLLFGSLALVADAANSLGDVLASLVILLWGRTRYAPPDDDHPHGHERIEPLAALSVGVLLMFVGAPLAYDAVDALLTGSRGRFSGLLVAAFAIGLALKGVQYWYTRRVNRRLNAPGLRALEADARADIYALLGAAVGVAGIAMGYPVLDSLAGGLVSLLIVREGFAVSAENTRYLTGRAPPRRVTDRIRRTVRAHPDVLAVRDLNVHYIGPEIEIELVADIDRSHTAEEASRIELELMERLGSLENVNDVHVRLHPVKTVTET